MWGGAGTAAPFAPWLIMVNPVNGCTIGCQPFHVLHTVTETRLLANQSSHFQNVIL